MYNIKEVINRLKDIANLETNTQLATILNVSYNTLNTWIKREKLPQEVLIEFASKYNASLDYILFRKNNMQNATPKLSSNTLFDEIEGNQFTYYGKIAEINSEYGLNLTLNRDNLHSNALYLLKIENIYSVMHVNIDIFNKKANILENYITTKTISIDKFKEINLGMIENITPVI